MAAIILLHLKNAPICGWESTQADGTFQEVDSYQGPALPMALKLLPRAKA
jgi:hypothetical protein